MIHPTTPMLNDTAHERPYLRLVSIAWGRKYVQEFLDFCLPALLSPGNVPALAEHFDVELVFLTEQAQFEQVRSSAVHARALDACRFRLVGLDDLVAVRGSYGMSLTYAFFRGFEDLGAAMTETYVLFIHADFILADGSYRRLIPHLLRGERLILAPSYCVVAEDVRPRLAAAREADDTVLTLAPRQMADLVIRNRHFTVRGKTVNQRFFHLRYIEQFYWMVDETTMLAHQLPIAVVAMKPERHLTEMTSYWDYGIIQEFCPSMQFTVLGDSDDFLMLELRGRDTAKQDLLPGWPEPADIAAVLATFITDYKRVIGRSRLTVHSRDLTPETAVAHDALDRFVDTVYSHLPDKLLHHLDHPQWTHHFPTFHEARARHLDAVRDAAAVSPEADAAPEDVAGSAAADAALSLHMGMRLQALVRELTQEMFRYLSDDVARPFGSGIAALTDYAGKVARYEAAAADVRERRMLTASRGDSARSRLAVDMAARRIEDAALEARKALEATRATIDEFIAGEWSRHAHIAATSRAFTDATRVLASVAPPGATVVPQPGRVGHLRRVSRMLFGVAPDYRGWHWLASSTRLAITAALDAAPPGSRVLMIGTGFGESWHLEARGLYILAVPIDLAREQGMLSCCIDAQPSFDACIIESDVADLRNFRSLFQELRPVLRDGSKVVALFLNTGSATVPVHDPDFLRSAFPACGPARIAYSGSGAASIAFRIRARIERVLVDRYRVRPGLAIGAAMAAAAPFALLASVAEANRTLDNAYVPPARITSVTIECAIG
jgi:hypothetical protein